MHKKRGNGRTNSGYNIGHLYSFYRKNIRPIKSIISGKRTRGEYELKGSKEYNGILSDLNEGIMSLLIGDNFQFKMPYALGSLRIMRKKRNYKLDNEGNLITKSIPVDWKQTNLLWENDPEARKNRTFVFHANLHSNGCRFSFHWSKAKTNNITVMGFRPTRTNKRQLARHILTSERINYFE